jgi:hypothetical protein
VAAHLGLRNPQFADQTQARDQLEKCHVLHGAAVVVSADQMMPAHQLQRLDVGQRVFLMR